MSHHRDIFERVRRHPGMWVSPETFDSVASFVTGFDAARDGAVLRGFREWLQLYGARGSNLAWPWLVLALAFPNDEPGEGSLVDAAAHRHAIDTLFELFAEFDDVVGQRDGLTAIYVAFDRRSRRGGAVAFARRSTATSPGARAVDALLDSYAELPFPASWFPARVRELVSPETIADVMEWLPDDVRELVIAWVQQTYAADPARARPALSPEQVAREQLLVDWVRAQSRLHWPRIAGEPALGPIERRLWWPEPALGAIKRQPARVLTYLDPAIVDAVIEHLPDDIRAAVIAWARETFAPGRELPTPRPWAARRGAEEALVAWLARADGVVPPHAS